MKAPPEYKIPPVKCPTGKYWKQPPRERIVLDEHHALMRKQEFETLQDCTANRPDHPFEGKMWRTIFRGVWWLMWYERDLFDPNETVINWRQILVVE